MPVRYYPTSKIVPNLSAEFENYLTSTGEPYNGIYYLTYDGNAFTGPNPQVGPNEPLVKLLTVDNSPFLQRTGLSQSQKADLISKTNVSFNRISGRPTPYYPNPTAEDYKRGYVIRYFTKKENERGFVTEISQEEYSDLVNGTADYDISLYQTTKILWKLTGPLRSQRKSQYNVIPGIVDTNQRLTETANKTFLGILEFIGGDYAKFARPTM